MDGVVDCTDHNVFSLKTRLGHIYKIIEMHRWIIEAYISDFYVKNHWEKLPPSWQQYLEQLDFSQLSCLLTGQPWDLSANGTGSVCPLSLLALKASCDNYSLRRHCVDLDSPYIVSSILQTLQHKGPVRTTTEQVEGNSWSQNSLDTVKNKTLNFKNGQLMEMEHIFRKHVKPKKQHEICQLGKVIHLMAELSSSGHVVDVGAGLGHLSRLLTFAHGLKVTTVEATDGHAPKASEFDRQLKKDIQKKLKKTDPGIQLAEPAVATPSELPSHVVCMVQPDISTQQFLSLVLNAGAKEDATTEQANAQQTDERLPQALETQRECRVPVECEMVVSSGSKSKVIGFVHKEQGNVSLRPDQSTCVLLNHECHAGAPESIDSILHTCQHQGESAVKILKYEAENQNQYEIVRECERCPAEVSVCSRMRARHAETCLHSDERRAVDRNQSACDSDILCKNIGKHQDSRDQLTEIHSSETCTTSKTTLDHVANISNPLRFSNHERNSTVNASDNEDLCAKVFHDERDMSRDADSFSSDQNIYEDQKEMKVSVSEEKVQWELVKEKEEEQGMVLAGLHACGDLTATLLRVFVNCPAVTGLVSVGCCYMKLSTCSADDETHPERGYPTSQFVQSLPTHPLTYESREMACHFADAYAQRLLDSPPHLKIHSYRAAVQYILAQTRPDFVPGATRLVIKKGAEMPFPQYASQCLRRLKMDISEVPDDVMATAESLTSDWKNVVAFYTLRLSLAPLVETALLLDRMLFLYEHGIHSVLLPVFDSSLSPRNFALLACKPGFKQDQQEYR